MLRKDIERTLEPDSTTTDKVLTCLNRILPDREFKRYVHEKREGDEFKSLGRIIILASILAPLINAAIASGKEGSEKIIFPMIFIGAIMFMLGSLIYSLDSVQATNRNYLTEKMSMISREDLTLIYNAWQSNVKNEFDGRSRKKAALVIKANLAYIQEKELLDPESIEGLKKVLDETLYFDE